MHSPHSHQDCVSQAIAKAEGICAAQGAKLTPPRKQVLSLIWQSHRPAKAYDLLAQLQQVDAQAKPPTIYRALDFLLQQGLVHKVQSLNAYIGCPKPSHADPCILLICQQCEEVTEASSQNLIKEIKALTNKNQFTAEHFTHEIAGKCSDCSESNVML